MSVPAGSHLLPWWQGPRGAWNSPGCTWVCSSQYIHCHRAEGFTAPKVSVTGRCCPVWSMHTLKKNPYPNGPDFWRQNSTTMTQDSRGDIHPVPKTHTHRRGFSLPFRSYHIGRAIPLTPQEPGTEEQTQCLGGTRVWDLVKHGPAGANCLFTHHRRGVQCSRKRGSLAMQKNQTAFSGHWNIKKIKNAWLHERQPETCILTQPPAFPLGSWVLSH